MPERLGENCEAILPILILRYDGLKRHLSPWQGGPKGKVFPEIVQHRSISDDTRHHPRPTHGVRIRELNAPARAAAGSRFDLSLARQQGIDGVRELFRGTRG